MKNALLFLSLVILPACSGKDTDHPERKEDWYAQHDAERHARVAECKNDAAQWRTPDCQNALAAQQEITVFGKRE